MRLATTTHLLLAVLCACRSDLVTGPGPGSDAGLADSDIVLPAVIGILRGGSAFALVTTQGTEPITGLGAEAPAYLTPTFDSDRLVPGDPVLLRLDASADAPEWTMATLKVTGTRAGVPVVSEMQVSMNADSPIFVGSAVVDPPIVDVSNGSPATARLILAPMSTATKGTVSFRPLRFIRFDPPTVELAGLQPAFVTVTVSPDIRAVAGTTIPLEGFTGRARAFAYALALVAREPDVPVSYPPSPLGYDIPEVVYVPQGGTVSVDLTRSQAAQRATTWTFADVPEGVTATAAEGILAFVAAPTALGGAHVVRLHGSRDGFTEKQLFRLFVGRADGDWPVLGNSPTAPDDQGALHPGSTAMAVDPMGGVYVVCPDRARRNLMLFKDGAWSEYGPLGSCGTIDSASSKVCYVGRVDESAAGSQLVGGCWAPPQAMPLVSTVSSEGAQAFGDVVVGSVAAGQVFFKWSASSWARVGALSPPLAGAVVDLASLPTGVVAATSTPVEHFTPGGWVYTTELQVRVFDGQAATLLDGLGASLGFPPRDPNLPMADVLWPAAMEVGPDGHPVVAWIDSTDDAIHVSRWDGTGWHPLAVPLTGSTGFFIDAVRLKLDPTGTPIVAWLEAGFPTSEWAADMPSRAPAHIRVHRLGAGGWESLSPTTLTLDADGPASDLSLAVDASGRPHVSWKEADRVFVARHAR